MTAGATSTFNVRQPRRRGRYWGVDKELESIAGGDSGRARNPSWRKNAVFSNVLGLPSE